MTTRRLLALGAIATLAVGAAACSPDDAEETPTAVPTTTASESPTASAEETTTAETSTPSIPPPDPADYPGKDEHTEEGAKQAARYYWASLIWAYQSGDGSMLEPLFVASCENCASNLESVQYAADSGKLWSQASIEGEGVKSSDPGEYEHVIQYTFVVSAHDEPDYHSDTIEKVPETRYITGTGLNWDGGKWMVAGVNFETEPVS